MVERPLRVGEGCQDLMAEGGRQFVDSMFMFGGRLFKFGFC